MLLTADIGVRTSQRLLEEIRTSLTRKELKDPDAVWAFLRQRSAQILTLDAPALTFDGAKPFVLLVIGVNGSGKTTTIGKLAAQLVADGKKVLLAAGDTFRAAATEQLEIWANRVGATLVRGKEGADPSSVIFEGVKRATAEGFDVVIADTAGRLHTKTDLMEELQKVRRVDRKGGPGRAARDLAGDRFDQRPERDRAGADLHAGDGGIGDRPDEARRHRQGRRDPGHRRPAADSRCVTSASASGSRISGSSIPRRSSKRCIRANASNSLPVRPTPRRSVRRSHVVAQVWPTFRDFNCLPKNHHVIVRQLRSGSISH